MLKNSVVEMQSLVMMSIFLFGYCSGEPPAHGGHLHEHQGFAQPQQFLHQHENEIEGLQIPKFDSSSYNSLLAKTSEEDYKHSFKSISNEYGTPRFGNENSRPFSADHEMPDSMYGVPGNEMSDQGTHFITPSELYNSPESRGTGQDSFHNHEDHFFMKDHNSNMDFQGYEGSQSHEANVLGHRNFDSLPEVIAARQSVSPLKGAVEGITQAIIRPNPPFKTRNAMTNSSHSHHKSPKSRTSESKKSHKHSPKLSASQGYSSMPEQWVRKYDQKKLQHHREVDEPSKRYLPTGRNAHNNAELQEDGGDQNYEFEYTVNDYQSASDFGHRESRQFGTTHGMYHVLLPDGRKQIVEYEADEEGFKPRITYEEPEIDTRDQSGGYDDNSNNLARKIQEEEHQNNKGIPRRSQEPY